MTALMIIGWFAMLGLSFLGAQWVLKKTGNL